MAQRILTKNQLARLPNYLTLLKKYKSQGLEFVNAQEISDDLNLNREVVKKDIAAISKSNGIPNRGREINALIRDLEEVLGYDDIHNAILVGVGNLGRALINYKGFEEYGLKIVAAFDNNPSKIGLKVDNIRVLDVRNLLKSFKDFNAKIGIICVPKESAQEVADIMCDAGFLAIWNFSPTHINLKKDDVILSNTNVATALAVVSHQLFLKKEKEKRGNK